VQWRATRLLISSVPPEVAKFLQLVKKIKQAYSNTKHLA